MGTQISFLEVNLPNRNKIINSEDLKNRLLHPICYCFDLGGYKLGDLFNSPYEFGNVKVIVKHIGQIKYNSTENIQKLLFHYEHVKEFENAYDFLDTNKPISKVLIKNEIIVYSYQNKLLVNANVKDAKNMIKCIKESVCSQSNLNGKKKSEFMDSFLTNFTINIAKFMEHLIQEFGANVKAIYAGDIAEKENTAIAIYGDEANKGTIYEQVKKQGNKLSCITVKINVNNAEKSRNILFNKDFGIMIFGAFEEDYAIQQIIECTKIVERFLNV